MYSNPTNYTLQNILERQILTIKDMKNSNPRSITNVKKAKRSLLSLIFANPRKIQRKLNNEIEIPFDLTTFPPIPPPFPRNPLIHSPRDGSTFDHNPVVGVTQPIENRSRLIDQSFLLLSSHNQPTTSVQESREP